MILNRMGQSYVSYADFAVAMVDEIEQAKHVRERVTPVSCDPFFRNAPQYYPVTIYKFSRAGAFMSLSIDNVKYGKGTLSLTTCRGNRVHSRAAEGSRLFRIFPWGTAPRPRSRPRCSRRAAWPTRTSWATWPAPSASCAARQTPAAKRA